MRKDVETIKNGLDEFKTDTNKKLDNLGDDLKEIINKPAKESSEIKIGVKVGVITGIICLVAGYILNALF
jgi:hypothetical protein